MKRLSRNNSKLQDKWVWIELHGVRKNDKGWLYGGKSDLLAFETRKTFIVVRRRRLIKLTEESVNFDEVVGTSSEAKYKIYSRKGRPDKLTLIETNKLRTISKQEWKKNYK